MSILYLAIAFVLGALLSLQPPINAHVASIMGSPLLAAACSISISLALVLSGWALFDSASLDWSRFSTLPWWTLVGGMAGALFVIGALIVAPRMGVAAFFVFVVLGQLVGAAAIDQIGVYSAASGITWPRALGILLVVAGATITQVRF